MSGNVTSGQGGVGRMVFCAGAPGAISSSPFILQVNASFLEKEKLGHLVTGTNTSYTTPPPKLLVSLKSRNIKHYFLTHF